MKILRGGLLKFLDTQKGGSEKLVGLGGGGCCENLYTSKQTGGGGGLLKSSTVSEGSAKISSFKFQYLHPPPPPMSY